MGLVWMDSCDSYSVTADIARRWTGTPLTGSLYNATAGRNGAGAIQSVSTSQSIRTPAIFAGSINVRQCVGMWLKLSAVPSAQLNAFDFRSIGDAIAGGVSISATTGYLRLLRDSLVVQAIGNINVCDNQWHWVEFNFAMNNAGVTLSCYVDTIYQWVGNYGISTSVSVSGMYITFPASVTMTIDDIVMYDDQTAVSPKLTDFPLGPRLVSTIRPGADNSVQFAPNSGSNNYSRLNEQAQDGDVTYVQDNVSGHADSYDYDNLGFTPTVINTAMLTTILKNPGVGSINHKLRCISGVTTNDGTSTVTPTIYGESRAIYDRDPNTSAAWTGANLDAAKFGVAIP